MIIFISNLVYLLARCLAATWRYEIVGSEHRDAARLAGRGSYVLAIWHQNLFAGILAQTGTKHVVIISRSRDGDPVAHLCSRLGHQVARGSSKKDGREKGGKEAKDEMIEQLIAGLPGAVTVDGPQGPPHIVKPGIIEMARRAAVPIVPYAVLPSRCWTFNSWDRFRLPKPFSRIRVCYGAPLFIAAETPFEDFPQHQQAVTDALMTLENQHKKFS